MDNQQVIKELKDITEKYLTEGIEELENSIGGYNDICEIIEDLERNIIDFIYNVEFPKDNFDAFGLTVDLFEKTIEDCNSFMTSIEKINTLSYSIPEDKGLENIKTFIQDIQNDLDYEVDKEYDDYCIYKFTETVKEVYDKIKNL